MKNILLTGFKPFGDYLENISEQVVTNLKNIGDFRVYGLIFPTKIFDPEILSAGNIIVEKAKDISAVAIISLGMSSEVIGFRIESIATNWVENDKYCLPEENCRLVDNRFSVLNREYSNLNQWGFGKLWNQEKLITQLKNWDLPLEPQFSIDAGNYCCNALMFRTLKALKEEKCDIPYLFLHLPCSLEAIKNMISFDQKKDIASVEKVTKILQATLDCLESKK